MLHQIIRDSGESQTTWAARIGVSASYLSSLLNGHRVPSLQVAARIEALTDGQVPAASWVRLSSPSQPSDAA